MPPLAPLDRPHRFWLVANAAAHSASAELIAAIRARLADHGGKIVGETDFPRNALPAPGELDAVGADVLVAYGGDGTITGATCALRDWDGAILALPGGTMNLVTKKLHQRREPLEILDAVLGAPALRSLPLIEVGEYRSYARIIAGPAARLVSVRERLRDQRWGHAWRALRFAWQLMAARAIGISGERGRYSALIVHATADEALALDRVAKGGPLHALRLAWSWLGGLLLEGGALVREERRRLTITAERPVAIVIDGEERLLEPPLHLEPVGGPACFLVAAKQSEQRERAAGSRDDSAVGLSGTRGGGVGVMTRRRIRHLPVVESGAMVGIVSIGDLVKYQIDQLAAEAALMRDYIQEA
ncbi:diacylglycerol kinase family protein [Sphingomicrobium astaxanthinifaciens]|uniref:diacylglycerol kinase family protein n=1 Tax=Sphingomicrobium astaxanthinifaciens TaxID=1227949 RepID=UPI001FCB40B4|nr:diacylglycerol kinase family protein [Sphingomicrobium astaxanthinifaciens]MCJ7421065.1 CBS domain-containing protein [Sphingomicrobium astaxanthinifaciens]